MFNLTFDPMYSFGSEATSLEYSILSSMLNGTDPTLLAHTPEYDQTSAAIPVNSLQSYENSATTNSGWSSTNAGFTSQPGYSSSTGAAQQSDADNASSSYTKTPSASAALDGTPGIASADLVSGGNPAYSPLDNFPATPVMNMQSGTQTTPTGARIAAPGGFQALEIPSPSPQKIVIDNEQQQAQQQQTEVKFEQQSPSRRLLDQPPTENIGQVTEYAAGGAREDNSAQNTNTNGAAAAASAAQALSAAQRPDQAWAERVAKVYKDRTRPFPYTEGYHFLIKHVTKK